MVLGGGLTIGCGCGGLVSMKALILFMTLGLYGCHKQPVEERYTVTSGQWTDFDGKSSHVTIKLDTQTGQCWQLSEEPVTAGPENAEGIVPVLKAANGQPLMYQRWMEIPDKPLVFGR